MNDEGQIRVAALAVLGAVGAWVALAGFLMVWDVQCRDDGGGYPHSGFCPECPEGF